MDEKFGAGAEMTQAQTDEIMATRTAPRVTIETIKDKIANRDFIYSDQLTICVVTMYNGFMVVGKSAPASPSNYDRGLGEKFAFDDCIKQLFQLEGYLLCHTLAVSGEPVPEGPVGPWGRYKSHKTVEAGRIIGMGHLDGKYLLMLEGNHEVQVSEHYLQHFKPQEGGYYVKYADGYESWSPADAFEEGYRAI